MKNLYDNMCIQKNIYLYRNQYVILDIDLSKILKLNILKIIRKFPQENIFWFKEKNNYLITEEGIIFLSIVLNSNRCNKKIIMLLDSIELLSKSNDIYYLNRIKQI